jgi:hypothetical protein
VTEKTLNRRDLNRLALTALGGFAAGVMGGCCPSNPGKQASANEGAPLLQDPHVCRGVNTCKNKGKNGTTNECAGQGHCATAKAHSCQGSNDCRGQGGCGEHPGENECKGQGACEVPLKAKTWPKARKKFEELMTEAKKKFGDAPES